MLPPRRSRNCFRTQAQLRRFTIPRMSKNKGKADRGQALAWETCSLSIAVIAQSRNEGNGTSNSSNSSGKKSS